MELRLVREKTQNGATRGVLFVDGVFECFTLEDPVREQPDVPVAEWKVQGDTAIPSGRYRVNVTPSARFKRLLPELVGVPGFSGIRIHPGNWAANTQGCILPGLGLSKAMVTNSAIAFNVLFAKIISAADTVWITVENQP